MMKPLIERITDLIAERPGIRNVEIADALEVDCDLVRASLQPRVVSGRILVEKVISNISEHQVNAYRINPDWKPGRVSMKQVDRQQPDDEDDGKPERVPMRQTLVPQSEWVRDKQEPEGRKAKSAKPGRAPASPIPKAAPDKAPEPGKAVLVPSLGTTSNGLGWKLPEVLTADEIRRHTASAAAEPDSKTYRSSDLKSESDEFACAVFHDGRAEIRAGGVSVVLTAAQRMIVARHFGHFPMEAQQ